MYRVKSIVLLGLALLLFAGCFVPALNPPYLETDLIEDDRIIGTWVGKDGKNSGKWIFTKETGRTYSLLIADEEATDRLTAHLFSLDGETYLDLYPGKLRTEDLGTITTFHKATSTRTSITSTSTASLSTSTNGPEKSVG